jgi:ligand-binding sensor domain-containing protein
MKRIRKIMILALSLQMFFSVGYAQWTQSTFPITNHVTDLKFYGNILYVATYGAGIFQTQNFTTWTPLNNGISTLNINEIITAIEGSNITLYAATDAGVFRSTMLGMNWTAVNNGLTNLNVATVYSDGTNLYAGT